MRDSFDKLIQARRTAKDFSGKPVAQTDIEQLLHWAVRAPNHHLNQPWRFVALNQKAILRLIETLNQKMSEPDRKSCAKIFDRLAKAGALVFVGVLPDTNATLNDENFAAACAAVQNILLGSASLGLGSYWSTNRVMTHELTQEFIGWSNKELRFVAGIWIGDCASTPPLSERKAIEEVCQFLTF